LSWSRCRSCATAAAWSRLDYTGCSEESFDLDGLTDLLRLLTEQHEFPAEPLGAIPRLPPVGEAAAARAAGGPSPANQIAGAQLFDRATGDAETELEATLGRLVDAEDDGHFPLGSFLPADYRQAAVDALEDRGLRNVRRQIDQAYNECDRLNRRLEGRFWDDSPLPEQAPAEVVEDDRLPGAISKVENAIGALRELQSAALAGPSMASTCA
jgi:hypothetical protein